MQDQNSWIFFPTEVECLASNNGINFSSIGKFDLDATQQSDISTIKNLVFQFNNAQFRYVKIVAKQLGELPEWHIGYKYDGRSWIFIDEISIK